MNREIITISVGQAGVQLGGRVWEQYSAEHEIQADGTRGEEASQDSNFNTFFEETEEGQFVPRAVFVDLEPMVINDLKRSAGGKKFNENFFLAGTEDAASNWARGFYTVGKQMFDQIADKVRKLVDSCDSNQGFLVNHAVGGGTGGGLGSLLLEHLSLNYRKQTKIGFEIYPSPHLATAVTEPYNAVLTTHYLVDHTDISVVLDNQALYGLCTKKLGLNTPCYSNLNRIISKVISSMTASLRFDGAQNIDMGEFQTNLVPFPRLHFMSSSLAPISGASDIEFLNVNTRHLTDECVHPSNFLVSFPDFDSHDDKYMAMVVNYRGDVKGKNVNECLANVRAQKKVTFVDWVPTGFKVGLNSETACALPDDDMCAANRGATMIGNNVAISRRFNLFRNKFDMLYSQRAYVFWYVGEGMEEGELMEAREDLGFLEKDYLDIQTESTSIESDDEYYQ